MISSRRSALQTLTGAALVPQAKSQTRRASDAGREKIAKRWWESAATMCRVHIRPGRNRKAMNLRDEAALADELDLMRAQGVRSLEVFAPAHGGYSFDGLDTVDRYRLQPEAGTMDDFKRLVRMSHARGLPIISFDNLGYSSVEAVNFLKACDDVKAGRQTRESKFYLWSDREDAPPPGSNRGSTYFMVRPTHLAGYDSSKNELWTWSDRAGKYFWSKWAGVDLQRKRTRLPQYNWGSLEFQDEAERIVRFWMNTGIDGMVIDAVNWYVDYTWQLGRQRITRVIDSYGNAYSQPEGAGGFHEDPVPWVTEGGWNSVQDYGLGIWWEKGSDVIGQALESGDPRPIESALRDYRDRVVAAGAVLYFTVFEHAHPAEVDKRLLVLATATGIGELLCITRNANGIAIDDRDVLALVKLKQGHPALHNRSTRRMLPVTKPDRHYAFLQTALDRSERVLVVLNYRPTPEIVEVDASGILATSYTNLRTGDTVRQANTLSLDLPAYGHAFLRVNA